MLALLEIVALTNALSLTFGSQLGPNRVRTSDRESRARAHSDTMTRNWCVGSRSKQLYCKSMRLEAGAIRARC